jgi:sarcosine oxidase/L-pipecolate oxidase
MDTGINRVGVIGAGTIGSWAALHLAEAGVETTLLEQFPLPHTRGSSHGASRAFRFLGDETMDRLDYSMERWRALERSAKQPLFQRTGLLNFGPAEDPWLKRFMGIVRAAGKSCDWLDAAAIRERYPALNYPADWGAAWDPDGGILFAHRCVSAAQARFLQLGGRVMNAAARRVETGADASVRIEVKPPESKHAKALEFDRVVVCAGPWTGQLLPQLAPHLTTVAVPVTYWRDVDGGHAVTDGFPILYNARLKGIYGLPACEYPGLVKILYHGGPEADPDTRDVPGRQAYVDKVSAYVREHLPGLDWRQPAIQETCMYTITPDNEPIIDRLTGGIIVGCGFSGSGFKHSPASGRMLAALALGKESGLAPGYQLEKYRAERFRGP